MLDVVVTATLTTEFVPTSDVMSKLSQVPAAKPPLDATTAPTAGALVQVIPFSVQLLSETAATATPVVFALFA